MTEGATKDYAFGEKNNWRRAMWNEVLRRTDGREKTDPILYLAGPDDLDRGIAVSKGVPNQNLIAVDKCFANVERVRSRKHPALHVPDVMDVLWSWPNRVRVAAVLLDYCKGIHDCNLGIYDAFQRPCLRESIIAINLQRGRDAWSNRMRETLDESDLRAEFIRRMRPHRAVFGTVDSETHRALQFVLYHAYDTFATSLGMGTGSLTLEECESGSGKCKVPSCKPTDSWYYSFVEGIALHFAIMKPRFFSYRSGNKFFDSAVLNHGLRDVSMSGKFEELQAMFRRVIPFDPTTTTEAKERAWGIPEISRTIAAMLAVRTMRTSGKLAV